jgi:hypothetical protein
MQEIMGCRPVSRLPYVQFHALQGRWRHFVWRA